MPGVVTLEGASSVLGVPGSDAAPMLSALVNEHTVKFDDHTRIRSKDTNDNLTIRLINLSKTNKIYPGVD